MYGFEKNAQMGHCNVPKEILYFLHIPEQNKSLADSEGGYVESTPSLTLRPSIWKTRYGDGADFGRTFYFLIEPMELGRGGLASSLYSVEESSFKHLVGLKHHLPLVRYQLLDIMIVQFRNEKVSNHGSIPITIDCNVVAFIVFEEGFHQPIKRTKQSVFLDVMVFRHTLVD
ncbi:hypothetical protein TNCV_4039231 [Trichonephila clavipes]|nr:hypothetical protein TNCV_4039231 [Trichonephila clavipes]